jgi:hypothetical protein
MKLNKILFCAAMTSILPLQHAFSAPVNSVEVQVIDTNGGQPAAAAEDERQHAGGGGPAVY